MRGGEGRGIEGGKGIFGVLRILAEDIVAADGEARAR